MGKHQKHRHPIRPTKMFLNSALSMAATLLLFVPILCLANQQAFGQSSGGFYPYYVPASAGYQSQYRQFGAAQPFSPYSPYSPYGRQFGSYSPYGQSPYSSSPYSANSYYGYGTNSPAFYQQNRPFGTLPANGRQYPYSSYPQNGLQYDTSFGTAGGSYYNRFNPYGGQH